MSRAKIVFQPYSEIKVPHNQGTHLAIVASGVVEDATTLDIFDMIV